MGYSALTLLFGWVAALPISDTDYRLAPTAVAPDTYVFVGRSEDFTMTNGGNIVNTGFIVTDDGVVVVDTGPSLKYGEQMRTAISTVTDKPVVRVYNTHLHPDHFLGNQAFSEAPVYALEKTIAGIRAHGGQFADNLYRLVDRWMQGTELRIPDRVAVPGRLELGGHELRLIEVSGHTDADLMILDETTGVLFAGDIVFNGRAPTTPHADVERWLRTVEALGALPFDVLVPGHGPLARARDGIAQTRNYLAWLQNTFEAAAAEGVDMAELLTHPIPEEFQDLEVLRSEFQRSVNHLFPASETRAVPLVESR